MNIGFISKKSHIEDGVTVHDDVELVEISMSQSENMNHDEFGTVLNGADTYKEIGLALATDSVVLVPWTDELGTQLDILLVWKPSFCAPSRQLIQGGVRSTDLFVSIMRKGAFGFEVDRTDTAGGYYAEKLGLEKGETALKLAEFLNGVKVALKAEIDGI